MRIGFILARPPVYSETFLVNLISGLQQDGFQVTLFTDSYDSTYKLSPLHVSPGKNIPKLFSSLFYGIILRPLVLLRFLKLEMNSDRKFMTSIRNLFQSIHILNYGKLDWIHFGFAALAPGKENVALAIKARMAISFRGYDISRFPLSRPSVYNLLWTRVDRVHTISDALKLKAFRLGLRESTGVLKITPAINFEMWQTDGRVPEFPSSIRILSVARLHWSKGIEYTIKALSLLKESGINFHYTLIGDGKERDRLFLAAFQSNILNHVTFVGKKTQEEILEYYRQCDIYIQYSVQEGFCNSLLEAQAAGLPCIASDAEGLPENIIDNVTGWIVPAFAPELLAEKIRQVLQLSYKDRNEICINAVNRVKEHFSLELQRKIFREFYYE